MAHLKIYETINQLVGEIIALDNSDPGFRSSAEVIANKINDLVAEMIILAGIEPAAADATSAETISKTIQKHVTEIISLKQSITGAGQNTANADSTTDSYINQSVSTIAVIIAAFIDVNKSQFSDTAKATVVDRISQLVTQLIALDYSNAGFQPSAEIIVNGINERVGELIDLVKSNNSSFDATSAEKTKETMKELLTDMITMKKSKSVAGPDVQASAVAATDTNLEEIVKSINQVIADFIETNKSGMECSYILNPQIFLSIHDEYEIISSSISVVLSKPLCAKDFVTLNLYDSYLGLAYSSSFMVQKSLISFFTKHKNDTNLNLTNDEKSEIESFVTSNKFHFILRNQIVMNPIPKKLKKGQEHLKPKEFLERILMASSCLPDGIFQLGMVQDFFKRMKIPISEVKVAFQHFDLDIDQDIIRNNFYADNRPRPSPAFLTEIDRFQDLLEYTDLCPVVQAKLYKYLPFALVYDQKVDTMVNSCKNTDKNNRNLKVGIADRQEIHPIIDAIVIQFLRK